MIKVYAPTTESMEEETHQFYDELNSVKHQCKDHEIIMIMGYLNAKKGRERVGASVGSRVHGDRNDNGDVWIEWCKENGQMIENTWFRLRSRRLYNVYMEEPWKQL